MNSPSPRRLALFTLTALLLASFAPAARATNWYVDASATGIHTGNSPANAWTSFAQIAQISIQPDDIVWINSGTYNERFTIAKSGTNGHRITYIGTGSTRPILFGIDGSNANDIAVINLEIRQLSTANNYAAIQLTNSARWLIEDNYIHDTFMSGVNCGSNPLSSYNIIRHNTFADLGSIGGGQANGNSGTVVVSMIGDHNLIEYNTIVHSMDRFRPFGTGNVVRNNYIGATDTLLYPSSSPYPYHTDGCQSFNGVAPLVQLLYERNYDVDNRDGGGRALPSPAANGHSLIVQDTSGGAAGVFNWYLYRFNVTIREADSVAIFYNVRKVRFYNNTIAGCGVDHTTIYNNAITWDNGATPSDDYDFRNNTFSYNPNLVDSSGLIELTNRPTNFTTAANHSFNASGSLGVLPTGASPGNIAQTNPLFTDGTGQAGHDNYTLTAGSPLKGSAAPVTTASANGSGSTSLTVADAKRLFDGWGIADADVIKIGAAGTYVRISSIDYTNNIVTLASAQTWNSGDGVFVKGSEDVGGLPYSFAKSFVVTNTSPALVGGATLLSATVDNVDAVRMVEFLVDGRPVGISYSQPYAVSFNFTPDGNSHTTTVRAYAAWATTNLISSSSVASAPTGALIHVIVQ